MFKYPATVWFTWSYSIQLQY